MSNILVISVAKLVVIGYLRMFLLTGQVYTVIILIFMC